MKKGGRLFYIGSGTPGRLGIVDASECPPTYGVDNNVIIGIIAGGDYAIRNSVENAEDDINQAWKDLKKYNLARKNYSGTMGCIGLKKNDLINILKTVTKKTKIKIVA